MSSKDGAQNSSEPRAYGVKQLAMRETTEAAALGIPESVTAVGCSDWRLSSWRDTAFGFCLTRSAAAQTQYELSSARTVDQSPGRAFFP
jgi:hypothetical protein